MHILEISSLNYSETFDTNFNVSKTTSLSHYNANQSIAANTALQENVSPVKKKKGGGEEKIKVEGRFLSFAHLNNYFNRQYFHTYRHILASFYLEEKN